MLEESAAKNLRHTQPLLGNSQRESLVWIHTRCLWQRNCTACIDNKATICNPGLLQKRGGFWMFKMWCSLHACNSNCDNICDTNSHFCLKMRTHGEDTVLPDCSGSRCCIHLFIWRHFSFFETGKQCWIVMNTLNFTPELYFSCIHSFSSKVPTEAGHSQCNSNFTPLLFYCWQLENSEPCTTHTWLFPCCISLDRTSL